MEDWSLKAKAAVNDDDDDGQSSMQTSTEASSQNQATTETPGRFDVLLGRGKKHTGHPGNERLQIALNMHSVRYNAATTSRNEKTRITEEIVQSIQTTSDPPGRFVRFDKEANGWLEVDDVAARIKVSHAIRYASRYKKRRSPPATLEASLREANTMGSDASRRHEVQHQPERPGARSPLVFDESILAGLGHDIHHSSNDTNDDDTSVLYDRSHPSKEDPVA
jgi:hypothetical protein